MKVKTKLKLKICRKVVDILSQIISAFTIIASVILVVVNSLITSFAGIPLVAIIFSPIIITIIIVLINGTLYAVDTWHEDIVDTDGRQ